MNTDKDIDLDIISESESYSTSDTDSESEFLLSNHLFKPISCEPELPFIHELFKYVDTDETILYNKNVNIVLFHIDSINNQYFIRFLLEKKENILSFPNTTIHQSIKHDILKSLGYYELLNEMKFKGHIKFQSQDFVFIQSNVLFTNDCLNDNSQYWFCTVDEIINQRSAYKYTVCNVVHTFLSSNPEFFLLKNVKTGLYYEIPTVVYLGDVYDIVRINGCYGFQRIHESSWTGPNYCFTTLQNTIKPKVDGIKPKVDGIKPKVDVVKPNVFKDDVDLNNWGINRVAIMLGNHIVIYNSKIIDELSTNTIDLSYYDSIYVNSKDMNGPKWIVKSHFNIFPLTYHLVK